MRSSLLIVLLSALALGTAKADDVVLNNGRVISGTVLKEGKSTVIVRLSDGSKLNLPRSMVKKIRRSEGSSPDTKTGRKTESGGGPVRLRWRFKPGQELKLQSSSSRRFEVVHEKKRERVGKTEESTTDVTIKVLTAGTDRFELEITIDRTRTRTKEDGEREVRKDSKDPNPDRQPKDMGMIGQPLVVMLSSRGEVLEVISFAGVRVRDLEPKKQRDVDLTIGEWLVRWTLLALTGNFPKDPVRSGGAKWSESITFTLPNLGAMTIRATNQLRGVSGGVADIVQTGKVEVPGLQRQKLRSSKITGRIRFSLGRGRILDADQTVFMTIGEGATGPAIDCRLRMKLRAR